MQQKLMTKRQNDKTRQNKKAKKKKKAKNKNGRGNDVFARTSR